MYLRVGGLLFPLDSCAVGRSGNATLSDAGIPVLFTWTWDVTCYLRSDQAVALNRQGDFAIQAANVLTALATPLQDIAFLADDGTPTEMTLYNFGSLDGVKVTAVSNPPDQGEYAANRTVRFTAVAAYPLPATEGVWLSYSETLTAVGTGRAQKRNRLTLDGIGARQIVWPVSMCRATQSGTAVGWRAYPLAPFPLWPDDEHEEQRVDAKTTPVRSVFGYSKYPRNWSYSFERIGVPFLGLPNPQP